MFVCLWDVHGNALGDLNVHDYVLFKKNQELDFCMSISM